MLLTSHHFTDSALPANELVRKIEQRHYPGAERSPYEDFKRKQVV